MTEQTISRLRSALDEMVQAFEEHVVLPERECRCHLAPPCNDCVENDFARNALANARDVLRLMDAPPPGAVPKCRCHLEERKTCSLCILDRFPLPADDTIRLGDVHLAKDFLS